MSGFYGNKTGGGGYGGNKGDAQKGSLGNDDKILCSVDKKWERADQFSNNERKKYLEAKRRNKPYNLRCRKHTQAPAPELTCSNCDEVKLLGEFSNAQRKADPDVRRCRDCINFTETVQLYDDLDVAGPNASKDDYAFPSEDVSPGFDQTYYSDDEEDDNKLPGVGRSQLQDDASTNATLPDGTAHLTSHFLNSHDENNPRYPPQGVPGSYGASSAPSDTGSVATTDTVFASQRGLTGFTAYGPSGQVQRRLPSMVTPSEAASTATAVSAAAAAAAVPVTRSGWAKVPTRKMNLETIDTTAKGAKDDENVEPKRYDYYSDGSEDEC